MGVPASYRGRSRARVRKQSEGLVELGIDVHVLTRGGEEQPAEADVNGVTVHRVREPTRPAELNEFVAWVERMNSDMLAAGVELGDRYDFDIVHGHDWLVANACDHLAKRFDAPLVTTIHATEHGRHQGWVDKHPQSYIHGVERWITNRSDLVLVCSTFMREQVCDIFGVEPAGRGARQRDRPRGPPAPRPRGWRSCAPSSRRRTRSSSCWSAAWSTRRASRSRSRRCRRSSSAVPAPASSSPARAPTSRS